VEPYFSSNGEEGNTEGRHVTVDPTILAYIAGFLDGDGSIFFQLVRRKDYHYGYQVRCSLAFYQNRKNAAILDWLQSVFKKGYIRHRKTGINDYTIVEPGEVRNILVLLEPYVRLKLEHVRLGVRILDTLKQVSDADGFLEVCRMVDRFKDLNYSKKRRISSDDVQRFLERQRYIAPVETDSDKEESHLAMRRMAKTPTASSR
jgi:hypothetical protein